MGETSAPGVSDLPSDLWGLARIYQAAGRRAFSADRRTRGSTAAQGNIKKYIITRDGACPIAFVGELIGFGSNKNGQDGRWVIVEIYRTQGGKFVARINHFTCYQGEENQRAAISVATAVEVIEWLKEGNKNVGSVSQKAIQDAVADDEQFAAAWVEQVE